jgi:hypothetical protein
MISELLAASFYLRKRLSSYIDLPKRLGTSCIPSGIDCNRRRETRIILYLPAVVVMNSETSNDNENETMSHHRRNGET